MPGKLVIVESPAKAKTIERYLGPGYEVRASLGHVRDLIGRACRRHRRPTTLYDEITLRPGVGLLERDQVG